MTRTFRSVVDFKCPFCGGKASVVKPDGVMHAEPPCETFVKLDVVDYLAAVNRENPKLN